MAKDWVGGNAAVFKTLGASNHKNGERQKEDYVEKALQIVPKGRKVAMFLKLTFLEGKGRRRLFQTQPPCRVWVSSSRLKCAANGDFDAMAGSAQAYAWFIWEKGYKGETILKWFN